MAIRNYKTFIKEVLDLINNCESSELVCDDINSENWGKCVLIAKDQLEELVSEINLIADDYEKYLSITPVPFTVAKWVDDLFMLISNCEGPELRRELYKLAHREFWFYQR
jgi:hypothetical protein